MHTTPSLRALAIFLSLSPSIDALVVRKSNAPAQEVYRGARRGLTPDKRQEEVLDCPDNDYQALLDSNPKSRIATFCNRWLDIEPATTVLEVTPTFTITTSAAITTSYTSTTRLITTRTVMETTTTTRAPNARRAANIAAIAADVIDSVIESGSATTTASSKSPQRLQAESGLESACSCEIVQPTATITSSFTLPPVYTTVGVRKVFIVRRTDTKVFTSTTTLTESASTSSSVASSKEASGSQSPNASITVLPPATRLTETDLPPSKSSGSGNPVVTAIPFTCPGDAGKHIDQVVGGIRLDYLVLCDTEAVTQKRLGSPIAVDSMTACAAQCSLFNAKSGQDTCQAASFKPSANGQPGGSCTLSGSEPEYVSKPGSVTVVHTRTFANGNECRGLEPSASHSPVDTSALAASITAAPFSLSTPGLITESANGGVFHTYVSANSTDANGYVHWSWYEVSASSSYWWAVYSTSWECTATLTRTIVTRPPEPITISTVLVTTIVHGSVTTIISGTSTSIVTNGGNGGGGGVAPPTFVPATTTLSNGEITTIFSLASRTSDSGNGLIPPTATPTSSPVAGNATVSGSTAIFFSTAHSGVIAPSSLLPSGDVLTIIFTDRNQASTSGSTMANSRNASQGVIPPPSTISGSSGIVTPSTDTVVSSTASPSVPEGSNSTVVSTGSLVFSTSGSTATAASTGDSGIIPPASSANASTVTSRPVVSEGTIFATSRSTLASNSTSDSGVIPPIRTPGTVTVTVTVTSGVQSFATSDSTIALASTGNSGIIPPAPSANGSTLLSVSATSGVATFATSGSVIKSSGTGDSGVIPPLSTVSPVLPSSSPAGSQTTPLTTGDITITVTTTITPIIPTSLTNSTVVGGSNGVTVQRSTAVVSSTGANGLIPPMVTSPPSSNSSTSTGPPFTWSAGGGRSGSMDVSVSSMGGTGSSGIIRPSSNSTTSAPPSQTPTPSLNITSTGPSFTNSGGDRTGSFSVPISSMGGTGSSGIIRPSNSTTSAPPSQTPTPSLNMTSTGPSFTNSGGDRTGSFSVPISSMGGTGSSGIIRPSSNSTTSAPPSQTPTSSLNTTSTGPSFTNSGGDRTGSFSTSSGLISSVGSSGIIVPSSNASITVPPTSSSTPVQNATSTGTPFSNTDNLRSGSFSLPSSTLSNFTQPGTGISASPTSSLPSTTLVTPTTTLVTPPVFANVSTSATLPSTLILPVGSSSGMPTPSSNSTTRFPTAASSTLPPASINSTSSAIPSLSSGVPTIPSNTTSAPTGGASSFVPPLSNSSTILSITLASSSIDTTSIPSVAPSPSFNLTTSSFLMTGSSSFPSMTPSTSLNVTASSFLLTGSSSIPSATPTISFNSSTPLSICPTAPLLITVTAVETSIRLQTTTLVQTVTVGASSTFSAAPLAVSSFVPAVPSIAAESSSIAPASSSVAVESSSVASASPSLAPSAIPARELGKPATQAQIDAACADTGNIVRNPNFALSKESTVPDWSVDDTDPAITVGSERSPSGTGSIAQFKSAIVGRTLTIKQALVLCPGKQYSFAALTRQAHKEAGCTVEYAVGKDKITENTPAETWLETSSFFTAGAGIEGASADLKITASCQATANNPISVSDPDSWMRVEVSGVSVVQDKSLLKRMRRMNRERKRATLEAQRVEEQGYAAVIFEDEQSG